MLEGARIPSRKPRKRAPAKKASKRAVQGIREHHVTKKRAHRQTLSQKAEAHWKLHGPRARRAYLERVRTALETEGFKSTLFQWRHKGHAYGLVKDLGDKQIHVRVYDDGVIDAEIEVHRRFVQHLWSPRPSAHRQIQRIFDRHGIPVQFVNEKYLPKVGVHRRDDPKFRTRVSHVVGAVAGGVGLVGLYAAKLYLKRLRDRNGTGRSA